MTSGLYASNGNGLVLECRDLLIGRGSQACAPPISLSVGRGEIVAIIGRNGSGKSTFLNTLAAQTPRLGGRCRVLGQDAVGDISHRLARSGLAFISDQHNVFLTLTMRENIELASGHACTTEMASLTTYPLTSLETRLDALAGTLSGGERQVFSIGCALARRPKLLIADELTKGVHHTTRRLLLRRLMARCADSELSMVFTDEDSAVIDAIASTKFDVERGCSSNNAFVKISDML